MVDDSDKMYLNILRGGIVMNVTHITNYKPKDFAELIGISVKTLQQWDKEGILKANRTPTFPDMLPEL